MDPESSIKKDINERQAEIQKQLDELKAKQQLEIQTLDQPPPMDTQKRQELGA